MERVDEKPLAGLIKTEECVVYMAIYSYLAR